MREQSDNREHPPIPLEARACMWIILERGLSCPFEATYLLTERGDLEPREGSPLHTVAQLQDREEPEAEFPVCRVHLEPMVDHLLVGQPRTRPVPLTLEVLA